MARLKSKSDTPSKQTRQRSSKRRVNYAESSENDSSDDATGESSDYASDHEDSDHAAEPSPSPRHSTKLFAQLKKTRKRRTLAASTTPSTRKPTIGARTIHRVNAARSIEPMRKREQSCATSMTPYELARERLHVSAVPDSLPCRENEFTDIMGYLESAIEEGTGTCIYISGVPGTGKTATVLEVIRHLQHKADNKALSAFDFVEINGMKLTDPNQAYSILWECLDRSANPNAPKTRRLTSSHALQLLEAKFSERIADQKVTVVLMDELDLLVTKKQTVMYNFFEWPNRTFSKLIVVAVANTMDLPERMLSNKVSSRMGLTRINFQPYSHQQLYQIVESRLQGIDAFESDAVEYASRKVSAVSGDARRALDICRRAVEIVESRLSNTELTAASAKHVTITVVNEAIREMFSSPSVAFIQSCSLYQKLFLVTVLQRARRTGLAEVEFGDAAQYITQLCKWHHIEPLSTTELMRVCASLGQTRALVVEDSRMDLGMRMSLNVVEEDIVMACKSDKVVGRLLKN